jgi:hypothetical protein
MDQNKLNEKKAENMKSQNNLKPPKVQKKSIIGKISEQNFFER